MISGAMRAEQIRTISSSVFKLLPCILSFNIHSSVDALPASLSVALHAAHRWHHWQKSALLCCLLKKILIGLFMMVSNLKR